MVWLKKPHWWPSGQGFCLCCWRPEVQISYSFHWLLCQTPFFYWVTVSTGWPVISILWLGDVTSSIGNCPFCRTSNCLSRSFPWDTLHVAGMLSNQETSSVERRNCCHASGLEMRNICLALQKRYITINLIKPLAAYYWWMLDAGVPVALVTSTWPEWSYFRSVVCGFQSKCLKSVMEHLKVSAKVLNVCRMLLGVWLRFKWKSGCCLCVCWCHIVCKAFIWQWLVRYDCKAFTLW